MVDQIVSRIHIFRRDASFLLPKEVRYDKSATKENEVKILKVGADPWLSYEGREGS